MGRRVRKVSSLKEYNVVDRVPTAGCFLLKIS